MAAADPDAPRGAYGLRIRGVEEARELLVDADPGWPGLELTWRIGKANDEPEWVTPDRARLRLRTGGHIEIDRIAERVVFVVPRPLHAEELVHPYLAPVAAVMAHWLGRESVHAGAFVAGGGVWGVVGDRKSGKSSTLANLALDGVEIVCDDMLVLDEMTALAGPRMIDLREEPATRLGVGESLGFAGARERWRLRLGGVANGLELKGWIHLAWGDRLEASRLEGAERVIRLIEQRGARLPPATHSVLFDLASLPTWELRRPQVWESLGETADCLRELARG
jgi:hypothetical protein